VFVIERRIGRNKLFFSRSRKRKKDETLYAVVFSTNNTYYIGTVFLKKEKESEE